MHGKAYRIYNKRAKNIEESIHAIFDESNDGKLSGSTVQDLNLNNHTGDEEEKAIEVSAPKGDPKSNLSIKIRKKKFHLKKRIKLVILEVLLSKLRAR